MSNFQRRIQFRICVDYSQMHPSVLVYQFVHITFHVKCSFDNAGDLWFIPVVWDFVVNMEQWN